MILHLLALNMKMLEANNEKSCNANPSLSSVVCACCCCSDCHLSHPASRRVLYRYEMSAFSNNKWHGIFKQTATAAAAAAAPQVAGRRLCMILDYFRATCWRRTMRLAREWRCVICTVCSVSFLLLHRQSAVPSERPRAIKLRITCSFEQKIARHLAPDSDSWTCGCSSSVPSHGKEKNYDTEYWSCFRARCCRRTTKLLYRVHLVVFEEQISRHVAAESDWCS